MKGSLLTALLLTSYISFSQPSIKLYGYSQKFVPGMARQNDAPDENGGQPIAQPFVKTNYYIYLSSFPSTVITPIAIWIAGKWDTITSASIVKTPVKTDIPGEKQLVPATKLTVKQISIGDTLHKPMFSSPTLEKMMKENELIIYYTWKGKKYFAKLKKLVVLETVHGV